MAHLTNAQQDDSPRTNASPYCADPNCESCRELRTMQEAIRLHQPLPRVPRQREPDQKPFRRA
jgi:hypothetical protein